MILLLYDVVSKNHTIEKMRKLRFQSFGLHTMRFTVVNMLPSSNECPLPRDFFYFAPAVQRSQVGCKRRFVQ